MKINCISCGHKLDLGDSYDDYNGPVKCYVCETLLEIRTEEGNLRSMAIFGSIPSTATKETGNRSAKKISSPPAVEAVMT